MAETISPEFLREKIRQAETEIAQIEREVSHLRSQLWGYEGLARELHKEIRLCRKQLARIGAPT